MIEQIKQALESANKTPWKTDKFGAVVNSNYELVQWCDGNAVVAEKEDAHLIANAPEWLRYLIGEVERLKEAEFQACSKHYEYHEEIEKLESQVDKLRDGISRALRAQGQYEAYHILTVTLQENSPDPWGEKVKP